MHRLLLVICPLALAVSLECGNDLDFQIDLQPTSPMRRLVHERMLSLNYTRSSAGFQPIRFHLEYLDLTLSDADVADLKNNIIPGAINWFQRVLSINPIVGKLTLDVTTCNGVPVPAKYRTVGVDADYILFVYGVGSVVPYVALAGPCAFEDGARKYPVAGVLQVNSQNYNGNLPAYVRIQVITHELTHALGFTPTSWAMFTQPDGTPYPSYNITETVRSEQVTKLTFPTVLKKVQEYFNCNSLNGAELENAGGGGTSSSHWGKRVFGNEYMIGSIGFMDFAFSSITLALFADSGWYNVNYTYTTPLIYGKSRGCSWNTDKCITNGVAEFPEFCTTVQEGCDYNHFRTAYCTIFTGLNITQANQYFSDPTQGSSDYLMDYCPVYLPYSNTDCRSNTIPRSYRTQVSGLNSRCFMGTFGKGAIQTSQMGSCHDIDCSVSPLIVHLDPTFNVTCPVDGGSITLTSPYNGTFICPRYIEICGAVSCKANCMGFGLCTQGICACDAGHSGISCENLCNAHCVSCSNTNATICLSCPNNASLLPSGDCTCNSGLTWNAVNLCVSTTCSPSCQTCAGTQCQTCWPNANLIGGNCNCATGYYSNSDGSVCNQCDSSCFTCTGPLATQCVTCYVNATISTSGRCVCAQGYYQYSDASLCLKCDSTCKTCSGSGVAMCTSCMSNAVMTQPYAAACACASGYGPSPDVTNCVQCDLSCLTCSGSGPKDCQTCYLYATLSGAKPSSCACINGYSPSPDLKTCSGTCDYTCKTCASSSSSPSQCSSCYPNAVSTSSFPSACVCASQYYPNPTTTSCNKCSYTCSSCISNSQYGCTACIAGKVLLDIGLICASACPYGYTSDGKVCTATPGKVFDMSFTNFTNYPVDSVSGRLGYCGSSQFFYPGPDNCDPTPIYGGFHFDGIADYIILPPNANDTTNLPFASTHYIEIWARPDQATNLLRCLLSKTYGSTNVMSFCVTAQSQLSLQMLFVNFNDQYSSVPQIFSAGTITYGRTWSLFAYQLVYSNKNTQVKLFINTNVVGTFQANSNAFLDYPGGAGSMLFLVGAVYQNYLFGSYFHGDIAELAMYQGMQVTPTIGTACGCTQCSSSNFCLAPCLFSEANVQGQCQSCSSTCIYGCVRTTDCALNNDPLCKTFTDFDSCQTCTSYAQVVNGKCACVANASISASGTTCSCTKPYQANNGVSCVACKKYFAVTDVSALYDPNFMQVYVNFSAPVDLTGFQTCGSVIMTDTLTALGTNPSCIWSSGNTMLNILLGNGATLLDDPIHLIANNLFTVTTSTICGYLPVTLSPVAEFTAALPAPTAVLTAPTIFSTSCSNDTLIISAEMSSGGFGRLLLYDWTINSSPANSALPTSSQLQNQFIFSIPSSTLTISVLAIGLSVQNAFNLTSSTAAQIQVQSALSVDVEISGGPVQLVKRSEGRVFSCHFRSPCLTTGAPVFTWTFGTTNSTVSTQASSALSPLSGNLRYLTPNILFPNCFYLYNVTVSLGNVFGFTLLNLTITKSDLVLVVTPSSGQFPITSDLVLSAQTSSDPDNLPGDISYKWMCLQGVSDCKASNGSLLLTSNISAQTVIPASSLVLRAVYSFTVQISKDTRVANATRVITVVPGNGCTLQLQVAEETIATQELMTVFPNVTISSVPTFLWSQLSGPTVQLLFPAASYLYIPPNTLQPGFTYSFQLSLTTSSSISAYFSVTVNLPPVGGAVTVTPNSGIVLQTLYRISTAQWDDPEGTGYPLSYQFYAGTIAISIRSLSGALTTKLGTNVTTLGIAVCDTFDSCSTVSASVTVSNSRRRLQSSESSAFLNDILDPDLIPSMILAYSSSFLLDAPSVSVMLSSLTSYTTAQMTIDSAFLDTATSCLEALKMQTRLLPNLTSSFIAYEVMVLQHLTDPLSLPLLIRSLNLFSSLNYTQSASGQVQWITGLLVSQYLDTQAPGQSPYVYNSPSFSIVAQRMMAPTLNQLSLSASVASMTFPVNFTTDIGIDNSTVVDVVFSRFNQTDQISDLVAIRASAVGKYSGGSLTFQQEAGKQAARS